MIDSSQHDERVTDLDPDLLATPFKAQTKWHVITGAPCCGKTTMIEQLAAKGFLTAPEAARQFFERELAITGRRIEEIREDAGACIDGILGMILEIEGGLDANEIICLDRGYPDALAFCRQQGRDPNDYLPDCFHHRYASVFMLDRFPVQLDGVRIEDEAAADYLDEWHFRDYTALGYRVVRVPVLPPGERLAFVLEKIAEGRQV